MNKKKNDFIIFNGKKLDANELIKEVNSFDKKYGIRLKHPDIWSEPDNYVDIFIANCEVNIMSLITLINGCKLEDYYDDEFQKFKGEEFFPVDINDEQFKSISQLYWKDESTNYNPSSLLFRLRFLTLVLSRFLGRIDTITKREVKSQDIHHSFNENRILLSKEIMTDLKNLMLLVIYGKSYRNTLLKVHNDMIYTKKKYKYNKLKDRLNNMIIDTKRNIQSGMFKKKFISDDLCINNILQISYILATGDFEGNSGTPNFKYIEGATSKHDLIKLYEYLGRKIIKKTKGKYDPMFVAFINARPTIYSQYYNECYVDFSLRVGITAIHYCKFVINDKCMNKFIDEMLKKGK